jgi:hypothetical protein
MRTFTIHLQLPISAEEFNLDIPTLIGDNRPVMAKHGPPKHCVQCGELKGLHEFRHSKREADGHMYQCRVCDTARRKKNYHQNQEQERIWKRKSKLKRYGLTPEDYRRMLEEQNGVCAICEKVTNFGLGILAVDHDHATGKVRALLCHKCNTGLGSFEDNELLLLRAAAYIARFPKCL